MSNSSENNLDFKADNPGAVQFGNFINYYQFNLPETRLQLLPDNVWGGNDQFFGLDIGCNAGDLTIGLYNFLENKVASCQMLGIDLDPTLIERATEQKPGGAKIQFQHLNIMNGPESELIIDNYFKDNNINEFNAVFCFSITMWIHLNHGDDGLMQFLKKVCSLGKLLIIEPQPWKCYGKAVKRLKQNNEEFPYFTQLKLRKNIEYDIENYLIESCGAQKIFQSDDRTKWGRRVLMFKTNNKE